MSDADSVAADSTALSDADSTAISDADNAARSEADSSAMSDADNAARNDADSSARSDADSSARSDADSVAADSTALSDTESTAISDAASVADSTKSVADSIDESVILAENFSQNLADDVVFCATDSIAVVDASAVNFLEQNVERVAKGSGAWIPIMVIVKLKIMNLCFNEKLTFQPDDIDSALLSIQQ